MSTIWLALAAGLMAADGARYEAEQIFPPNERQTHAPAIVELPNGDLLASWYTDSGKPGDEDSVILGARRKAGEKGWTEPFPMANRRGFPDANTCMMVDAKGRVWLFWPTVVGDSWETCLMNYRVASETGGDGAPEWAKEGIILLRPEDFGAEALSLLGDRKLRAPRGSKGGPEEQKAKLSESLFQRLGWANRCKPTVLPSGRIVLPLYTDTFAISIMALSDDGGETWFASKPLIGFGNIQPTVLRKEDGTLVAYMRENGDLGKIRVSESKDDGMSWGPVGVTNLPNPGSGIDGVRLANGHWLLVYNDASDTRARLAVSISEDEGKTWPFTRHVELDQNKKESYHYPSILQTKDGKIHLTYTHGGRPEGSTIRHAWFGEEWVKEGDRK